MTRVLVVSSFHATSTRDVWAKTCAGLGRQEGIKVIPYDLIGRHSMYSFLRDAAQRSKRAQQAWREFDPAAMTYEILIGAAHLHGCDTVLIISPQYMPVEIPQLLRRSGLRTAAYMTECPYEDTIHTPIIASAFDITFVNDLYSVGLFQSFCPRVEYVPHSFDMGVSFPPDDESVRKDRVTFIGTGYRSRVEFMHGVDWDGIDLELYGNFGQPWVNPRDRLRKYVRMPDEKRYVNGLVTGITTPEETNDLYRDSIASFSLHRVARHAHDPTVILDGEAYSAGPRTWELAACRTFQVSDHRQELVDVFGESLPIFDSPRGLQDLLRRAVKDRAWREELAYQQWEKAQPYEAGKVLRTIADAIAA